MKSEPESIRSVFQNRTQYRIPFFQRQYVWTPEDQWAALWEDITAKADQRIQGIRPHPHFLGAIVLEPGGEQDSLDAVPTYSVIDGQQRLTTLQFVLAAMSMVASQAGCEQCVRTIETLRWNENTFVNPNVERYKLWPTHPDRQVYKTVMSAKTWEELRSAYPGSYTQKDTFRKVGMEHPRPLQGHHFFSERIEEWLAETALANSASTDQCLNALAEALLADMQLVVIRLDAKDDAQVIFETLNGRGAQLTATDLIRNYVFLRADAEYVDAKELPSAKPPEQLYREYWMPFEQASWKQMQRRGRLVRPRLEWFIQTLTIRTLKDEVEIERLYPNFKALVEKSDAKTILELLETMSASGAAYAELVGGTGSGPVGEFGRQLSPWETTTVHPLALAIGTINCLDAEEKRLAFGHLCSYIVRRAVCGLTAKNYNNIFLGILRRIDEGSFDAASLANELAAFDSDASRWPEDGEFRNNWLTAPLYKWLGNKGVGAIFAEIENVKRQDQSAEEPFRKTDSHWIEHVLPQEWPEHWRLSNGDAVEKFEVEAVAIAQLAGVELNKRQQRIAAREAAVHRIGNLTLLSEEANRKLSNNPFASVPLENGRELKGKREGMFRKSVLLLNREFWEEDEWDEIRIQDRSEALFESALRIWPRSN